MTIENDAALLVTAAYAIVVGVIILAVCLVIHEREHRNDQ